MTLDDLKDIAREVVERNSNPQAAKMELMEMASNDVEFFTACAAYGKEILEAFAESMSYTKH